MQVVWSSDYHLKLIPEELVLSLFFALETRQELGQLDTVSCKDLSHIFCWLLHRQHT
jgi:hypothetical protein